MMDIERRDKELQVAAEALNTALERAEQCFAHEFGNTISGVVAMETAGCVLRYADSSLRIVQPPQYPNVSLCTTALQTRIAAASALAELWDLLQKKRGDRVRAARDATTRVLTFCNSVTAVCGHGVAFDSIAARDLTSEEIRRRWPRLMGPCPLGCGFNGIAYASHEHHIAGDW